MLTVLAVMRHLRDKSTYRYQFEPVLIHAQGFATAPIRSLKDCGKGTSAPRSSFRPNTCWLYEAGMVSKTDRHDPAGGAVDGGLHCTFDLLGTIRIAKPLASPFPNQALSSSQCVAPQDAYRYFQPHLLDALPLRNLGEQSKPRLQVQQPL